MDSDADASDQHLREDIRRLGEQLGDTLRRQEGPEFLELVERTRIASKAVRRGETSADEPREWLARLELRDVISELAGDLLVGYGGGMAVN